MSLAHGRDGRASYGVRIKGLCGLCWELRAEHPRLGGGMGVASSGCPVCILQMNVWRVESEVIGRDGLG